MNFPTVANDIKLLQKIFQKILENPSNERYRNLNMNKLQSKFVQYLASVDVLFRTGFTKSDDETRLKLKQPDNNQLHTLKLIHKQLLSLSTLKGDETNLTILNQMASKWKSDTQDQKESDYEYVVKISNPYRRISNVMFDCQLKDCLCLKIMCAILKKYQSYLREAEHNTINVFESIYSQIGNNYNSIDLLDDFNHLLIHHSDKFETIYHTLINSTFQCGCVLSNCLSIRRNHRNRSHMSKNETLRNELYFDGHDIVEQQLLDRIHCYFLHTFDMGYKLTGSEKQNIMNDETEEKSAYHHEANMSKRSKLSRINNIVMKKINMNRNIIEFDRIYKVNEPKNKFSSPQLEHEYNFGYRFFYWEPYRNNNDTVDRDVTSLNVTGQTANENGRLSDWFIDKKYCNFKTELLNNKICIISQSQWDALLTKAQIQIQTIKVKEMYCPRIVSAKNFEMFYGKPMAEDHLIAMMIYCNYDILQQKFSETYRKLDADESDDLFKKRHSNYYFLARLLRECVECFGTETATYEDITVYHGVNAQFLFSSMSAFIKGPFSSSADYSVALNFSHHTGMILELKILVTDGWTYAIDDGADAACRLPCLELSWISDYANEQEIFSIGGLHPFTFETVIEAPTGLNYIKYIAAMKKMTYGMNEGSMTTCFGMIEKSGLLPTIKTQPSSEQLLIIYRLLCHQLWKYDPSNKLATEFKRCPKYVDATLQLHCSRIKRIFVFPQVNKVNDHFFKYDNGWIKLELYLTIFPNVESLTYTAMNKDISFLEEPFIYECILMFLRQHPQTKLKTMNIMFDLGYQREIEKFVSKYKTLFEQMGWIIYVFGKKLNTFRQNNVQRVIQRNPEYLAVWNSDPTVRECVRNMTNQMGLPMFDPTNPSAFGSATIEIQNASYSPNFF